MPGGGGQRKKQTMTAKRTPPLSMLRRRNGGLRFRMWIAILMLACLAFWILLQYHQSELQSPNFAHRSRRVGGTLRGFEGTPTIAFLFLVRRNLPLDFLWGSFFEGVDVASYSIYIHSQPGFVLDESTTRSALFYGRQLSNSIQVAWGEASMIQAERLLLDAALDDPANQRFVLLSDSCVPLYNFSYIYNYIMESPRSFVDSFLLHSPRHFYRVLNISNPGGEGADGAGLGPLSSSIASGGNLQSMSHFRDCTTSFYLPLEWFTLIRRHAEVIVDDELVFLVFKKFCKRRPPIDGRKGKLNLKLQKQHNCIPDEHYVQTLLAMMGLEDQVERRTLTFTLWNEFASKMEGKGWHPVTFSYSSASPQKIKEIKDINHVYYETEYRTEWCRTNATSVPCFLFARKFSEGAAMRLLSEGI